MMYIYRKKIAFLAFIFVVLTKNTANANTIGYFTSYEYLSSVRGHYLAIGVKAQFQNVTFEISNGIKKSQRSDRNADKYSNGTLLAVHLFPFHKPNKNHRFLISASHLSDIFRGKPFNDREEPVDHFIGLGFTSKYQKYETSLLLGKESHDCSLDTGCNYSNQFKATVRYTF